MVPAISQLAIPALVDAAVGCADMRYFPGAHVGFACNSNRDGIGLLSFDSFLPVINIVMSIFSCANLPTTAWQARPGWMHTRQQSMKLCRN